MEVLYQLSYPGAEATLAALLRNRRRDTRDPPSPYSSILQCRSGVYNCVYKMVALASQSEREWILIGLVESCAAKGYEATSVNDICRAAGVSRESFEREFADKDECLAAAVEALLEEAWQRLEVARAPGMPWATALRAGAATLLGLLAERPGFARLALIEAPAAEGRASFLCTSAREALTSFVERGRDREAEQAGVPASAGRGAVAGVETLVTGCLLTGQAERLPELTSDVIYQLTVSYLGRPRALQEARGAGSKPGLRAVA